MLEYLFETVSFMPHGYCLVWRPDLVWIHGSADALIMCAYLTIPAAILHLLSRRRDLLNPRIAWLFVSFITLCGVTHGLGLLTIWQPVYGAEGLLKAVTAAVSIATAVMLWRIMPAILGQPSHEELIKAATELALKERLSEELERSNAALQSFATTAAHDLNAPLRSLRIVSNWIVRDLASPEPMVGSIEDHARALETQVQRMEHLIEGVLAYSRVGGGDARAVQSVNVSELVRECIEVHAPHSNCCVQIENQLPNILANEAALEIIFRNLIGNAIKFIDRTDGLVKVRFVRSDGRRAFFEVEDNGPGIPADYRRKVFEPFVKLESRDSAEGAGLGLAMVARVIEAQGGTIEIADGCDGRGAIFRFSVSISESGS